MASTEKIRAALREQLGRDPTDNEIKQEKKARKASKRPAVKKSKKGGKTVDEETDPDVLQHV